MGVTQGAADARAGAELIETLPRNHLAAIFNLALAAASGPLDVDAWVFAYGPTTTPAGAT